MPKEKYSVLIPTRNRPCYLRHSLATCLEQEESFDEIIVCDNSDEQLVPEVRSVCASLGTSLIKYVRPPNGPLCMTDNWNYAIEQSHGDYITIIGDDDGLLPWCVRIAKQISRETQCDVFRWGWAMYYWPSFRDENLQDRLLLWLSDPPGEIAFSGFDKRCTLRKVIKGDLSYVNLPMLYNSFVHRSVLNSICSDGCPILDAQSPDIYSGIAIAAKAKNVVTTTYPLGVAGQGSAANGAAHSYGDIKGDLAIDFQKLNLDQRIGEPRGTLNTGTIAVAVIDAYSRFAERYPEDVKEVSQTALDWARWQGRELAEKEHRLANVSESTSMLAPLIQHYESFPGAKKAITLAYNGYIKPIERLDSFSVKDKLLVIKGEVLRAYNVADICESIKKIMMSPNVSTRKGLLSPQLAKFVQQWLPPQLVRTIHPFYAAVRSWLKV